MKHLLLASALLSLSLAAADITPTPRPKPVAWEEIKTDVGILQPLTVEGKVVEWLLIDEAGAGLATLPDSTAAVFSASKSGRYRVIAVADGKLVRTVIVVGNAPDPGPNPKPPDPMPPVDELTKRLQAAYTADAGATKADDLKTLIELYSQAVTFAAKPDLATADDLFSAVRKAAGLLLPDNADGTRRLAAVRRIIAEELVIVLPTDPDAALTPAVRKAAAEAFGRYARALAGVVP